MIKKKKVSGFILDAATGQLKPITDEMPDVPPQPERRGIDFEKLKDVLLRRGVIASRAEIE